MLDFLDDDGFPDREDRSELLRGFLFCVGVDECELELVFASGARVEEEDFFFVEVFSILDEDLGLLLECFVDPVLVAEVDFVVFDRLDSTEVLTSLVDCRLLELDLDFRDFDFFDFVVLRPISKSCPLST